ncbi:MAG: DHH family phosphoesterase [Bacillota bacterium]
MYYLYSHNDLDGVGCGIIAKCAFGDEVDIRYNSISGLNFQVERYLNRVPVQGNPDDLLFITDLTVNSELEQRLDRYVKDGGHVRLIDHHKTANHFNDYPWAQVDVYHADGRLSSATSLFYEYLIKNGMLSRTESMDQFVELVRLYDTWEWESENKLQAKRLNDLFFMVSLDEFETKMVDRLRSQESFTFDEFEEKILDMEENKIERYIRRKRREMIQTFIGSECAGIVYAESYHSELASELGTSHPHLDFIAILNMGGRKMSLRTIHEHIDVSAIAMRYGGGGHAKASGCNIGDVVFKLFVEEPFELEPMRADAARNQFNIKGSETGVLYESWGDDKIFVYLSRSGQWAVEWNDEPLAFHFKTFEDAERHIKRNYGAWLARDEIYVSMLTDHMRRIRTGAMPLALPDFDGEATLEDI